MHFVTLFPILALLSTAGRAQYVLEDDFFAGNFFDAFSFFDSSDPTHGNVAYQTQANAASAGLISSTSTNARMGVDTTNVIPNGRPSVRLTSNKAYNSGTLVIIDLDHMPTGCGTWPAFWLVGPSWPNNGEIDIIEGVHDSSTNSITLHTGADCTIPSANNASAFSGNVGYTDCTSSGNSNNGCQITTPNTATYGPGFNANGGGVYAMEWTDAAISVFFFPRGSVPGDVSSGWPSPSGWGLPLAQFSNDGCDIATHFADLQIVFDTTFCGDWAGAVWGSSATCASKASSCAEFVANNPAAFTEAYWSVNGLKVYKSGGGTAWKGVVPNVTEVSSVAAVIAGPTISMLPIVLESTSSSEVASTTLALLAVLESSTSSEVVSTTPSLTVPTTPSLTVPTTSSLAIPTTPSIAISAKPTTPDLPVASSLAPVFRASNATNSSYPTGTGTGVGTAARGTGTRIFPSGASGTSGAPHHPTVHPIPSNPAQSLGPLPPLPSAIPGETPMPTPANERRAVLPKAPTDADIDTDNYMPPAFAAYRGGPAKYAPVVADDRSAAARARARHLRRHRRHGI